MTNIAIQTERECRRVIANKTHRINEILKHNSFSSIQFYSLQKCDKARKLTSRTTRSPVSLTAALNKEIQHEKYNL